MRVNKLQNKDEERTKNKIWKASSAFLIAVFLFGAIMPVVAKEGSLSSTILDNQTRDNTNIQNGFSTAAPTGTDVLVVSIIKHNPWNEKPVIEINDGKKIYDFAAGSGITVGEFNPILVTSTTGDLVLPRFSFWRITIHDGTSENDPAMIDGSFPVWTLANSERGYRITPNLRPLIENEGPSTSRTVTVSVDAFGGLSPFKYMARNFPMNFAQATKSWQITINFI